MSERTQLKFRRLYNAFLTYNRILEYYCKGSGAIDGSYFIGLTIIYSLICEIGIKALLTYEGKFVKEHHLDKLFNQLSGELQDIISNNTEYDLNSFKKELSKNSTHFIKWRYYYDEDCEVFNAKFITQLICSLNFIISKINEHILTEDSQ